MAQIEITLDGNVLPTPTTLIETSKQNATDNETLDGTLYTDFVNVKRSWQVTWKSLCQEDYDIIYAIFFDQFSTAVYPTVSIPFYSVSVPVKVGINEKDIYWDGNQLRNIVITLVEQYAIS